MNTELPIIVKPSRWAWGFWFVLWGIFFVVAYFLAAEASESARFEWWGRAIIYAIAALVGFTSLHAGWNFLVAPVRMIIDESGIGGRFARGLIGAKRIAWEDINMAFYVDEYNFFTRMTYSFIIVYVDNTGGKYPVRKFAHWWSLIALWEKLILWDENNNFVFNITNSKLDSEQAKAIVAIINNRAKGKPPDNQKPAKSPFAAE